MREGDTRDAIPYYDWPIGLLTWCEDCGDDASEYGGLRACPECGLELCFACGDSHQEYCNKDRE